MAVNTNTLDNVMLTTIDNPYSPFDEWEQWFNYDTTKGYNTCGYLARVTPNSPELSEEQQMSIIEEGLREIVEINAMGIHKLCKRSDFKKD